jgi:hypothetical protein
MPQGHALHISVPAPPPLDGVEFPALTGTSRDAQALAAIAEEAGFDVRVLDGAEATVDRVIRELERLRDIAESGDVILVTFSGHGWQITTADPDEPDKLDEVSLLADGPLVDNTIGEILHGAPSDVSVVAIFDSCRSRSASFIVEPEVKDVDPRLITDYLAAPPVQDSHTGKERPAATVLTLSAVDRDTKSAGENSKGGVFTTGLTYAWGQLRDAQPTWSQLLSRTAGYVAAYHLAELPQRPHATVRGRHTIIDERAFSPGRTGN